MLFVSSTLLIILFELFSIIHVEGVNSHYIINPGLNSIRSRRIVVLKTTSPNLVSFSRMLDPKAYDLFVIGAGSGGMAAARRAASYGFKVGIGESGRLGGTCVNVGCVPKKVMWNAAHIRDMIKQDFQHYGIDIVGKVKSDYSKLKLYRDNYVKRLNNIYKNNLEKSNIDVYNGHCSFLKNNLIQIKPHSVLSGDYSDNNTHTITAKNVLIATGGQSAKLHIPGEDLTINSDQFFELDSFPNRVAVIGAGYIAVELAGVFNAFGVKTDLFVRGDTALRYFDSMLKTSLHRHMTKDGITVHPGSIPVKIVKNDSQNEEHKNSTLSLELKNGQVHSNYGQILVAIGRAPKTEGLKLEAAGVELTETGHIRVDEFQNTSVPSIFALGDVCGKVELTPMAIAAGRRLADRLFGGLSGAKADYENVPSVIFSHPPIGTVGLTEAEAELRYGKDNLKVYTTSSVNLYYGVFQVDPAEKPKTEMKLICLKANEKIVGAHVIGMGADEMIQGFGVAIKMGATKQDLDNCVAVHPTAAEEFVTIAPWGLREEPKVEKRV